MSEVSIAYAKTQRGDTLDKRGNDHYATPECAIISLVANVPDLPRYIWEPCAGEGDLTNSLSKLGFTVYQSDKYQYDENPDCQIKDFFDYSIPPYTFDCSPVETIITNPPYKSQFPAKMAQHALTLVPRVFFLLRLAMLEGCSDIRNEVLDGGQLKNVYVYRDRLPRMHRRDWEGNKAGSTTAFAWFEWNRHYNGNPEIYRISSTDTLAKKLLT